MEPARVAVAGVGNNVSALLQGAAYYRECAKQAADVPGVRRSTIGGLAPFDLDFVAAFDTDPGKIARDLAEAIFIPPNNYPHLDLTLARQGVVVEPGISSPAETETEIQRVSRSIRDSGAEVLLYALPTGLGWAATAYASAALHAGVAFVNCTPDPVARDPDLLGRFTSECIPVLGDDLASHLGSSILHRTLLALFVDRGITIDSSYQINLGGNEDFRNLTTHGSVKRESKFNALAAATGVPLDRVEVIPSGGYVSSLRDNKVAYIQIEGRGWAGTPVSVDVRLRVQDSSNAAGVLVDLVRIAAIARRRGQGGFVAGAAPLFKSPPGGHGAFPPALVADSLESMGAGV